MNITQILDEAKRVENIGKTDDTARRKALRAPGDVGKVDRITQLDKDKSKTVAMQDTADRMRSAGPTQRAADEVLKGLGYKGKRGEKQVKRDASNPDQYAARVSEIGRDNLGNTSDRGETLEADPEGTEYPKRTDTARRMAKADLAGKDRISAADREFDDAIQDAESGALRKPAETDTDGGQKDMSVVDRPYLRHAYQPSGLGINKELQDSDLEYILNATKDDAPVDKKASNTKLQDSGSLETLSKKVKDPTARDLENLDPEAERIGSEDRAYLTPEVMKQQKEMRKALSTKNAAKRSEGVQGLAFQHEVSDDMVTKFMDSFGKAKDTIRGPGKNYLQAQIEGRGLDAGREKEAWGGDLGKAGEIYKNKNGTYNFTKMPEDLKRKAYENRTRDMVKTYLRQGGRDAYAMHEGIRSIADMDLEHISSLKGKGASAGRDGPDNWVFASGPLNMQRAENELTGEDGTITKYSQGPKAPDRENAFKTYDSLMKQDPELQKKFQKEFGGKLTNKGGTGPFSQVKYNEYSPTDIKGLRLQAEKIGMTADQAKTIFPDVRNPQAAPVPGTPVTYMGAGRDEYDKAVTGKQRNRVRVNDMIKKLKKVYPGKDEKGLLATPEGMTLRKQIEDDSVAPQQRPKSDFDDDA